MSEPIVDEAELQEARSHMLPGDHFTLRFIESNDNTISDRFAHVEVRVAGIPVGTLSLYEREWVAIWRALVNATPAFDFQGITLMRTGKFR